MEDVRATTARVASRSSHVTVDFAGIEKVAEAMKNSIPKVEWDFEGIHYCDNGPLTVQYLLVLDALNFCFWPDKDLSYDHLASGLKTTLENDHSAFDADRLQKYTGPDLRKMLKWQKPLPLEDERVRLLHEVGLELERNFDGKASKLVESCGKSAAKLVALITSHFPGFRDHTLYKGHQVFLYKRAQIFVADLWGAFKGQGYGEFSDIGSITIFADYIVPAVLQQLGVLKYSSSLANSIETNTEIGSGSEEEVELRACSVYAVEKMRELISKKSGKQVLSVELDLWLWAFGIRKKRVRETHSKDIGSLDILSSVCSVIPSCTLNSATGSISTHQWLLRAGLKLSCRRLIAFFSGNHAGDAEVPRPKPLFSDGKFERHDDMPLGVLFVVVDGPPSQLTDYDACMHHLKQASRSLP